MLNRSAINTNIENSGRVVSSQTCVHPQLDRLLRRHLENAWVQPFHRPSISAYQQLEIEGVFSSGQPVILDSGCGTGKSTRRIADSHPGHIVIGVDQSASRLAKSGMTSVFSRNGNCILLRSELSTFWRLLARDGQSIEKHYLLYPNPWPKPGHLSRRWHGHPVFPQLLALGAEIELRCNWEIYAAEFAQAVTTVTGGSVNVDLFEPEHAITPFEQKYQERGQALFRVLVPARFTRDSSHDRSTD